MGERSPEEQRQVDEAIIRRGYTSEAEMLADLDGLTPEQQAKLDDPAMFAPATQEELDRLGPDFTARVFRLVAERRAEQKKTE